MADRVKAVARYGTRALWPTRNRAVDNQRGTLVQDAMIAVWKA
jgi:hypothetical protein